MINTKIQAIQAQIQSVAPQTIDQFLAQGGSITTLAPAPVQKFNHYGKSQLLTLLRTGAKSIDELVNHIGSRKEVQNAYKAIKASGIPIIIKDGWVALDLSDITPKIDIEEGNAGRITTLNESQISFMIGKYYLYNKHLIAINNLYWTGYECDLFAVTQSLKTIEFEIKTSRHDFLRDAQKAKWKRPISVWKHYYIMPEQIYSPDMLHKIPNPNSGILVISRQGEGIYINERKKAIANKVPPIDAKQLLNITRLVSMRLWKGATA